MRRCQRPYRVRWSALECGFAAGEFVGVLLGLLPSCCPPGGVPPATKSQIAQDRRWLCRLGATTACVSILVQLQALDILLSKRIWLLGQELTHQGSYVYRRRIRRWLADRLGVSSGR